MRRTRTAAFTLIELLVVIAIIAILAAILFPVFAQAREKARQAVCLSNCKQIGMAVMMYADDYEESFPLYAHYPRQDQFWFEVIQPYAKNESIFTCPSVRVRVDKAPANLVGYPAFGLNGYGANYRHVIQFGPGFATGEAMGPKAVAALARPSETIMIADSQVQEGANAGQSWPLLYCPVEPGPISLTTEGIDKTWGLADRHSGGGNFIFADGHVRWMRREAVLGASKKAGEEMWG